MKKKLQYYLEYGMIRIIEFKVRLLPRMALQPLADIIAYFIFNLVQYRRKVALENLARAFPEKTSQEHLDIARRCYVHFVLMIFEFMKLAYYSSEMRREMVEVRDLELFQQIANNGKGTLLVSGHFGNWELAMAYIASLNKKKTVAIQQRQKNYRVDQYTVDIRRHWGIEMMYSKGAVSRGLAVLAQKQLLGMLCDQDGGKRGVFVPFFGQMASTHIGAALLFLKSQGDLVFGYCVRTAPLRFKLRFIPIEYDGTFEVNKENIRKVTAAFTAVLEKYIREYPEQYLWFHKRWKTSASLEKE